MRVSSVFLPLLLTAAAASAAGAAPDRAKNSLDWQGLYVGTLPCASCPGFYTELQLLGKRSYRISETAEEQETIIYVKMDDNVEALREKFPVLADQKSIEFWTTQCSSQ